MKTRNSLLLLLFFISSIIGFSQTNNWIYSLSSIDGIFPLVSATGNIQVHNNTIDIIKKDRIIHLSYYGEKVNEQILEINIPVFSQAAMISHIFPQQINGQTVTVASIVGLAGDNHYLSVYDDDGQQLGSSFETSTGTNNLNTNKKAIILEVENQDLIAFGSSSIDIYTLQNNYSWTVSTPVQHAFGNISSATKWEDNFFITTESGIAILLSPSFEILWQFDSTNPLESAIKAQDGFLLCGTNTDTDSAILTKIDEQGVQVWQHFFENKSAFSLLAIDNDFLIGGINVFSVNEDGELLWDREIPQSEGIFQMKNDPYDGILLLGRKRAYRLKTDRPSHFNKYNSIAVNNVEPHIAPWGNLDFDAGAMNYPLGSETSTVFANAPIFVGQTSNGDFKGFFNFYNNHGAFTSLPQNNSLENAHLWKITQTEINALQHRFNNEESLEPYSNAMLTYPAKGNPNCVIEGYFYNIDEELAPFVDANSDGIYNIFDGDYPVMKGDQMIWWAIQDTINEFEIHGQWYAYQCGDHIVSNTIYVDYEIFNTSTEGLTECRFGKFLDWDLGCYTDDYLGSLPNANAVYVYNTDAIDGTNGASCDQGINTYNDEIPVQSLVYLGEQMASSMVFQNGAFGSPPIATIDPQNLQELYNYMHASFRDGTPLTEGGSGYNPVSMNFIDFAFPGNPANNTEWSMVSENFPIADQRSLTASSSFELAANESKTFSFAFTTHPDIPHPAPDVSSIEASILEIRGFHDSGNSFAHLNLGEDIMIVSGQSIQLDAGEEGQFYTWSTGETTSSINITTPGDYSVTLTDLTGCERSDEINVSLATTGVKDIAGADLLVIHPNPVQKGNPAFIQLAEAQFVSEIRLFTVLGQNLSVQKLNSSTSFIQIDAVANLPRGIYLVQLSLMDDKTQVGKIIID